MTFQVGVSGAYKTCPSGGQKVGVGGVWKTIDKMWVGVSGAWKEFYTNIAASLPASFSMPDLTPANAAGLTIDSAGTYLAVSNGVTRSSGTWLDGGLNSDFEVRLTKTSGGLTSGGSALATWLAGSSTRQWTWNSAGVDDTWAGTLEIRLSAAPNTVLATAAVSVTFGSGS